MINKSQLHCSFCARSAKKIRNLIAGPDDIYICNECIAACVGLLDNLRSKEAETVSPAANCSSLPTPRSIKKFLDSYVIGQEVAKEVIAVAVYNHYKRLANPVIEDVEIDRSNIWLIGPTGSGKTLLVHTVARMLDVPFVSYDSTTLTEAGYVGADLEDTVGRLLAAADYDVKRAERGVIFLDEIEKKRSRDGVSSNSRDIAGEGVQQGLLKMLEGSEVMVPSSNRRGPNVDLVKVNTKNILFILGGAFVGLEKIIESSTEDGGSGIGFGGAVGKPKATVTELLSRIEPDHLVKYGIIPELVGRVPVIAVLEELTEDALVRILTEPKNALVKQFAKMFALDGVKLGFDDDALREIAKQAVRRKTNGRGLRGVLETRLRRTQFDLPDLREQGVEQIIVHLDTITDGSDPEVIYGKKVAVG